MRTRLFQRRNSIRWWHGWWRRSGTRIWFSTGGERDTPLRPWWNIKEHLYTGINYISWEPATFDQALVVLNLELFHPWFNISETPILKKSKVKFDAMAVLIVVVLIKKPVYTLFPYTKMFGEGSKTFFIQKIWDIFSFRVKCALLKRGWSESKIGAKEFHWIQNRRRDLLRHSGGDRRRTFYRPKNLSHFIRSFNPQFNFFISGEQRSRTRENFHHRSVTCNWFFSCHWTS